MNKVNLSRFSTQNLFQVSACVISARKAKHLDVTTMFTYSPANTPLSQSERTYYLSYFINDSIYEPLKQTKSSTFWCFAGLTIINSVSCNCFFTFQWKIPETNGTSEKAFLFSWLENYRRKFGYHVFKPFLNISFTLSRPIFVKRN